MAVAHVSTTAYEQTALAASHTISSYVVSAGSDRALIVTVAIEVNARTVSGITFNAEAFTLKSTHTYVPASGPDFRIEIWRLLAPTVTTANLVISITGGTATFSGGVTQATGVDQTTPLGTAVTSGAATANPSVTVADGAVGDLVIDILQESVGAATVGAGQTLDYDNTGLTFYFTHGSHEAGAASVVMSWTQSAGERHLVAINIKQVAAAGGADVRNHIIPAYTRLNA